MVNLAMMAELYHTSEISDISIWQYKKYVLKYYGKGDKKTELNSEFETGAQQSLSFFLNTFCNLFLLLQCRQAGIDPHNDQILHFKVLC